MGKYFKYGVYCITIIVLACIMIPNSYGASTGNVGFSGSTTVDTGADFSLNIVASGISGSITSIGGQITSDNTSCVQLKSIDYVDDSSDVNGSKFNFISTRGKSSDFVIVKANFVAGNTACTTNVNIVDLTRSFADGTEFGATKISQKITVGSGNQTPEEPKSSDATLKSLIPSKGTLSPAFTSANTSYSIEVESTVNSVTFTATKNNSKATITSGLTCQLTSNPTNCNVIVKAEDGTTKTYTVKVTKKTESNNPSDPNNPNNPSDPNPDDSNKDNKSSDATLKQLDVSGFTLIPKFNKDNTTYSMSVGSNITALNVTAIPNNEKAIVTISGASGWTEGVNTIKITVKAEDGTTKIYTVNVNKKGTSTSTTTEPKSSDNYLSGIEINNGEIKPSFDKNISSYSITVPNEITSLDLNPVLNDSKAKYIVTGNSDFKVGSGNIVTIEVTAEDSSIRVYTINVTRSDRNSDNKLTDIIVEGEPLSEFDPSKYTYTYELKEEKEKLTIDAIPANKNAKVEIIGNENLVEGNNTILIKVSDENGFVQYYRLNVNKNTTTKFLGLTIGQWLGVLGLLTLLSLIVFLFILLSKKNKKTETPVANNQPTPVIEFKPEFNFGSKNGTDDDIVEAGGVLNQYTGHKEIESPTELPPQEEQKFLGEAKIEEVPYDPYDDIVTKDELYDALQESMETNDSSKLKMLYAQEMLNRQKEKLREQEENRRKNGE